MYSTTLHYNYNALCGGLHEICSTACSLDLIAGCDMLHNNCNIVTCGLLDMYTQSPRAAGPRALGIHIRQITRACVTI